jgi:hypothetical protein
MLEREDDAAELEAAVCEGEEPAAETEVEIGAESSEAAAGGL